MKYVVTVPEQEFIVDSESPEEAVEQVLDFETIDAYAGRYYEQPSVPSPGMNPEHYIMKLFRESSAWEAGLHKYIRCSDSICFTDLKRLYIYNETPDFLNKYEEFAPIESSLEVFENCLSKKAFDDAVCRLKVDVNDVASIVTKEHIDPYYELKAGDKSICVNGRFLLEALYFTESNEVRFSENPRKMIYVGSYDSARRSGVLPVGNGR
ncbi:hypothetical protein bpr_II076 (plasmid) [Butyrivibrio proteoclasticus B316]|uniref:Uncharacterized protein n=1 Tax=Butyrivibrio proteoclasticus (strain ATCC 51982 / DSM 14932 / B316) TaxID=515622 RepID=E0S3N4_BUTPB|nr:hypothetical protein [Butyrivibrio proteoclasticus]ADL36016.1 hypothetical protein bpr_II076 [Butyrivibrio proteoclasticus B316]